MYASLALGHGQEGLRDLLRRASYNSTEENTLCSKPTMRNSESMCNSGRVCFPGSPMASIVGLVTLLVHECIGVETT